MLWDYIVVGGGLAGSVVFNSLLEFNNALKILVIEAGPNVNDREDSSGPTRQTRLGVTSTGTMPARREIAAAVYSLDGITVLTDTLVEKVLLKQSSCSIPAAHGVRLTNGTEIRGREFILSAGAIRTPHLSMLSGIGPVDELAKRDIDVLIESPEVGKNFADHTLAAFVWKYGWGTPADFLVSTTVPKDGLATAIEIDEGVAPDPEQHPLLKQNRTFIEHVYQYFASSDGSVVEFAATGLLPTARGSITLASKNISDQPVIDPNYLGTEVDRYGFRKGLRLQIGFAGSNKTIISRES
ncbi:uncharacterized protein JN550_003226 [Neoarthrinium moseri]|uniref:uncharacterized protein n=1 Tax=Neoarthrinium moseri TaxID=1658444 RepID=UPI001FDDF535|nr:uncharacterized protein JN550_003226 [Neoarthrinium moseri]KAI1873957.1 hypothetical protein JN550_003226 [Neoarthrinium moseri]